MWGLNAPAVYVARAPVDMRRSIDGLAILVSQVLAQDPFSAKLFVFTNRRHDRLKALQYDGNGFALFYKRLEKGAFRWPAISPAQTALVITPRQLEWLLAGLTIEQPQALPAVRAWAIA
jgi:transposase